MNERIKQLKHQASVWCDENIPEQFSEETNGYGAVWEDKFAELIGQDMLKLANRHGNIKPHSVNAYFGFALSDHLNGENIKRFVDERTN